MNVILTPTIVVIDKPVVFINDGKWRGEYFVGNGKAKLWDFIASMEYLQKIIHRRPNVDFIVDVRMDHLPDKLTWAHVSPWCTRVCTIK